MSVRGCKCLLRVFFRFPTYGWMESCDLELGIQDIVVSILRSLHAEICLKNTLIYFVKSPWMF